MDETLLKALGSAVGGGVVSGALLLILYKVGARIVERLIAAIDRIATSVDAHTKIDLEHHAEVREAVVRLEAKFDARHDSESFRRVDLDERTPESVRASTASELRRRKHRTPPG